MMNSGVHPLILIAGVGSLAAVVAIVFCLPSMTRLPTAPTESHAVTDISHHWD
jgi:hypothetical protein